jgi:glycine cleavage system H protein
MSSPSDCRFAESHEWFRKDGDLVTIGITTFAANELTDITYVELKPVGTTIAAGDSIGEVESVKTTSEVFCVVGGEIVEVNAELDDDPSRINSDAFGQGWLAKIKVADPSPLEALMDQPTYDQKYPVG